MDTTLRLVWFCCGLVWLLRWLGGTSEMNFRFVVAELLYFTSTTGLRCWKEKKRPVSHFVFFSLHCHGPMDIELISCFGLETSHRTPFFWQFTRTSTSFFSLGKPPDAVTGKLHLYRWICLDFLTKGLDFLKKNFAEWAIDINFRLRNFRLCYKLLNFVWDWLKDTCNLETGHQFFYFIQLNPIDHFSLGTLDLWLRGLVVCSRCGKHFDLWWGDFWTHHFNCGTYSRGWSGHFSLGGDSELLEDESTWRW